MWVLCRFSLWRQGMSLWGQYQLASTYVGQSEKCVLCQKRKMAVKSCRRLRWGRRKRGIGVEKDGK